MSKIIEYDIVRHSEIRELIMLVNQKLKKGWKLQGGLCHGYMTMYYQAIYREVQK